MSSSANHRYKESDKKVDRHGESNNAYGKKWPTGGYSYQECYYSNDWKSQPHDD